MKEEFDRGEKGRKTKTLEQKERKTEERTVTQPQTFHASAPRFFGTLANLSTSKYSSCKWKGKKYSRIGENLKGKLKREAKQKIKIVKAKLIDAPVSQHFEFAKLTNHRNEQKKINKIP